MSNTKYFSNKLKGKLEELKIYDLHLKANSKKIEDNKKQIAEELKNNPDSDKSIEAYEFVYYDHLHISRDMNIVATEIYYLDKISKELGMDLDLTEEERLTTDNISRNIIKKSYHLEGGKLNYVDKDAKENYLNSLQFKDGVDGMINLSNELSKTK